MESNVFATAWEILHTALEWFFPPSLLAEPIVGLCINLLEFGFGCWFLGILIVKPLYMFITWLFSQMG